MVASKLLSMFVPRAARDVEDLEAYRDITDDVIEADFAPYACLGDDHTILTKNGEVLQILRIDQLETQNLKSKNLRQAIRHALSSKLPDASYAFWLHTFRREKQYLGKPAFASETAAELYDAWHEEHRLARGFTNELYLTIVKASEPANLRDTQSFIRSLSVNYDISKRMKFIDGAMADLNKVVKDVLHVLEDFGANRLGLETREDGQVYGEHLEFLEKLINLEPRPMPVVQQDLSHYLTSGDVTFGYNSMEVRAADGKRRFATIMTIKEYKEASLLGIDAFLEIPCELIVTQNFDFIEADNAKETYETQAEYLRLSGDKELWHWAEFDKLLGEDTGEKAFGRQQTTLFLIAPSVQQLEQIVMMVRTAMAKLGIVAVREDLKLEELYWAQLPANFMFVARAEAINTQHLAGFVKMQEPPMGCERPGLTSQPVMMMRTASDAASYFGTSFENDEGQLFNHLAIIGQAESGYREFGHLITALATGIMKRVWVLDMSGSAQYLVESLGGTYQKLATESCPINPFVQADSPTTREFLALWCAGLLDPRGVQTSQPLIQFFHECAATVMKGDADMRNLRGFQQVLAEQDPMLAKQFDAWVQASNIALSGTQDALSFGAVSGFDLSHVAQNEATCAALSGYLLHRITMQLDGAPSLLVLDEGAILLANHLFRGRIADWLAYLTTQNTTILLTLSDFKTAAPLQTIAPIMQAMGQRIYFPDESLNMALAQQTGLDESQAQMLYELPSNRGLAMQICNDKMQLLQTSTAKLPDHLRAMLLGEKPAASQSQAQILSDLMGTPPGQKVGA
jgi:type IV secretion system protein VirB4